MMLKQSSNLKASAQRTKTISASQVDDLRSSNRENKIFSQRINNPSSSSKRFDSLASSRKTHERKGSTLLFSNQLFKNARKVDPNNPRQSFLPQESHLVTDNHTKIKILLSAYSKLQGKGKEGTSQKTSKIDRSYKANQIDYSPIKKGSAFCHPPLSSLTKLILNECNMFAADNGKPIQQIDSSLHQLLEQDRYSQWINLLCESSPPSRQNTGKQLDLHENPYELFKPKVGISKKSVRVQQSDACLHS